MGKYSVEEKLQSCIDTLKEIKDSGYWPFASPAPSSTEVKIKEGIYDAINGLERSIFWHQTVFGRGRDCMSAPSVKLVQIK